MRRAFFAIAAALFGAGCSLPLDLAQPYGPENTCSADDECGPGAVCSNEVCVATDVDLAGLLVEVRPHADAAFGATTSYLFDPAEAGIPLTTHGGAFIARMDPALPPSVAIREGRVRVALETPLDPGCPIGDDRTVPANITFYRVAPFAGLTLDPIPATTDKAHLFDVDLVLGRYDVYIEPQAVPGCNDDKPYPPVYRTGLDVLNDVTTLLLDLPALGTLTGTIADVGDQMLGGWKLDLVEPTRGLPISANAELMPAAAGLVPIQAQIAWPEKGVPILRLSPPAGTVQPTIFWNTSFFSGDITHPKLDVTAAGLFQPPVKVSGNVIGSDGFTRIRASLTIQSRSLEGPNAQNAAFAASNIDTDENGVFSLLLPRGTYDFRASPIDNGLAITDASFTINPAATCFCGQPFPLVRKLAISGTVTTKTNAALSGATISIVPAQEKARDYLTSTHTLPPRAAREATAGTNDEGAFEVLVDPGRSDLVIEALPGSGFPWLVRPRLDLSKDTLLSSLVVTHPALLSGVVRDPNGAPVPNAEVNAWFPVRDPGSEGGLFGTVVKIATTSTDENGNYTLVLPSSI